MSVLYCFGCQRHVDTDFDLDGKEGTDGYRCGRCVEAEEELLLQQAQESLREHDTPEHA